MTRRSLASYRAQPEPEPIVNEGLRAHVTRVGFDLTLGRTHIAALVWLNEAMDRYVDTRVSFVSPLRHAFANHASGLGGCITRGLVLHHFNEEAQRAQKVKPTSEWSARPHYTITRAGELVIELLRECGLYDEYRSALPISEESSTNR